MYDHTFLNNLHPVYEFPSNIPVVSLNKQIKRKAEMAV